jgi:cell division protein FtsA
MPKHNIGVGLDIGTTKVCSVIGELEEDNKIRILGVGTVPSAGVRKGVIINIESTTRAIQEALNEAELMAGVSATPLYVGVAGSHIKGVNSRGVIATSQGKTREISKKDLKRVLEAAQTVSLPSDREMLHVLPQEFSIDEQDGIKDPLGMVGGRLEVEVYIISADTSALQNILKSVTKAGYQIQNVVLKLLATADVTLLPDEKELGSILIDIGGGTTDIGIFIDGGIRHIESLPLGGLHVTNDIAVGLHITKRKAEEIKKDYGISLTSLVKEDEMLEVLTLSGQTKSISRSLLAEIIESRLEEILTLVKKDILQSGLAGKVCTGAVLTGGTALLSGISGLAEQVLEMPVRVAKLELALSGLKDKVASPIYTTVLGLLNYGLKEKTERKNSFLKKGSFLAQLSERVKKWWQEIF